MTNETSMPERRLRREKACSAETAHTVRTIDQEGIAQSIVADEPGSSINKPSKRQRPFNAADVAHVRSQQTPPFDTFRDAKQLLLCTTLERIAMPQGGDGLAADFADEAVAAVGLVPIANAALPFDIALKDRCRGVDAERAGGTDLGAGDRPDRLRPLTAHRTGSVPGSLRTALGEQAGQARPRRGPAARGVSGASMRRRERLKVQVFSDLHLDVAANKPITIMKGVGLVIVAGDTCEGVLKAFEQLRRIVPMAIPVVMVLGNHEYYRRFVPIELALAKEQAPAFNIHLLENDTVVIGGVRFAGSTLWTDYAAFGVSNIAGVMNACANGMNDHRLIGWQKQPWLRFRPQEAALLHHRSKAFLSETLATPFDGPTVVVSHHAPHWDSVHPRFKSDPLTGGFVSDLSGLIESGQPDLWIHGHVHNSSDYRVGRTRLIANPHGYGSENPAFNGQLVVEVGP